MSRHRLSRRGNRRPNAAIQMVVLSQRSDTGLDLVYDRRLAEGKSAEKRCKGQLCSVTYRYLLAPWSWPSPRAEVGLPSKVTKGR